MSNTETSTMPGTAQAGGRVYYIDWLRVIAMLSVFLFHSARFFDVFSDWHVRNSSTWIGGTIIVGFMNPWIMPLFFVLAGASTYYSLKSRSAGQYLQERVLRLLIPFIFGVIIITAPQAYYEQIYHGHLSGAAFPEFYLQYLINLPQRFLEFNFYHLWFLAVLFIFSIVCLPLFVDWWGKGKSLLALLSSKIDARWKLVILLILPLALADIFMYPGTFLGSRDFGGWCLIAHLLFFISGYIIISNPGITGLLQKLQWWATAMAIIAIATLIPFIGILVDWKENYGSLMYAASQVIQVLLSWSLLIIILNLGRSLLNFKNRFLTYASEAVLPFYILHQTVIISVGFYVVQWDIDPALKYLIIAVSSFSITMAIYELLVRRINVLRFLFGMRPRKKSTISVKAQTA
jgi:glucan biosynthesis protein C